MMCCIATTVHAFLDWNSLDESSLSRMYIEDYEGLANRHLPCSFFRNRGWKQSILRTTAPRFLIVLGRSHDALDAI